MKRKPKFGNARVTIDADQIQHLTVQWTRGDGARWRWELYCTPARARELAQAKKAEGEEYTITPSCAKPGSVVIGLSVRFEYGSERRETMTRMTSVFGASLAEAYERLQARVSGYLEDMSRIVTEGVRVGRVPTSVRKPKFGKK